MDAAELQKKIEHYGKLAQKNYYEYQQTGEPRYDRNYRKYEELEAVYRKAYETVKEEDDARTRRLTNMSCFIRDHIKTLDKQTYTKAEVIDLAERMKGLVI